MCDVTQPRWLSGSPNEKHKGTQKKKTRRFLRTFLKNPPQLKTVVSIRISRNTPPRTNTMNSYSYPATPGQEDVADTIMRLLGELDSEERGLELNPESCEATMSDFVNLPNPFEQQINYDK